MRSIIAFATAVVAIVYGQSSHIQYKIRSLQVKSRGVNLGGWLVAEQWMTWDSPLWYNVPNGWQSEHAAMQYLGPIQGQKQFDLHRSTWITETDIKLIAEAGLNLVRVPVGYWIQECAGLPESLANDCNVYAKGGLPYLDLLIQKWAKKYNVAVMISLHGAPGSQNGADHSGSIDGGSHWSSSYDNVQATKNFVSFLVARYKNEDAFLGIGLLNEPSGTTNQATMEQYYHDVYYIVRTIHGSDCILVTSPLLWFQSRGWGPQMEYFGQYMTNVWHDWHSYLIWGYEGVSEANILGQGAVGWARDMLYWQGHPIFLGEWSFATAWGTFQSDESTKQLIDTSLDMVSYAQAGWALWSWHVAGNNPWNRWNVKGLFNSYEHSNQFYSGMLPNMSQPVSIVGPTANERLDVYPWFNRAIVRNAKFIAQFGVVDLERWVYYGNTHQLRSDRTGECLDGFFQYNNYGAHGWSCDEANSNQKWLLTNHSLYHISWKRCLSIFPNGAKTLAPCNSSDSTQFFTVNEIARFVAADESNFVTSTTNSGVKKSNAIDSSSQWNVQYDTNLIVNLATGECLDGYEPKDGGTVHTWPCSTSNVNQKWQYDPLTRQLRHLTHQGYCLDLSHAPVLFTCRSISDSLFKSQQIYLEWISYPALNITSAVSQTHIQPQLRDGKVKAHGTNLGGWLVAEHWMTWDSPIWKDVPSDIANQGEYQTMLHLGQDDGQKAFDTHRSNWITETHIKQIRDAGLNLVRVPVGYWIKGCDGLPMDLAKQCSVYASGGLAYLDKLIQSWAKVHNVAVLINVHGAPGSQNGADHSAPAVAGSHWSESMDNVQATRDFVVFLVSRYKNEESFLGVSLMNEPSGTTDHNVLTQYYTQVYDDVRNVIGSDCILVTSPLLWYQSVGAGTNMEDFGPTMKNVWHDWHPYVVWGYGDKTADEILSQGIGGWAKDIQAWKGHPLFLGEWSMTVPGGKFTTNEQNKALVTAMLNMVNGAKGGWAFWSWRTSGDNTWNSWSFSGLVNAYEPISSFSNWQASDTSKSIIFYGTTSTLVGDVSRINMALAQDATWNAIVGMQSLEGWVYNRATHQLRSDRFDDCLDGYYDTQSQLYQVHTWDCGSSNTNQKWKIESHRIVHESSLLCLTLLADGSKLLSKCDATSPMQFWTTTERVQIALPQQQRVGMFGQRVVRVIIPEDMAWQPPSLEWIIDYKKHSIQNKASGYCLHVDEPVHVGSSVGLRPCDSLNTNQEWKIDALHSQVIYNDYCLSVAREATLVTCDASSYDQQLSINWLDYPVLH